MLKHASSRLKNFHYYTKGEKPRLLVHSGTHGDEWEVIELVKKALQKYEAKLPDFIFVPEVSPSAVKLRTRVNGNGVDINRIFSSASSDREVRENIAILNGHHFDLLVSFHEDPVSDEYYVYDSGFKTGKTKEILKHNLKLKKSGIKLLNGLDDPDDPELGYEFKDGYRKFVFTHKIKNDGMVSVWSMTQGIVEQAVTPEIPGLLPIKKKQLIVDSFFSEVLVKYLNI
jgi:hypothetical protein